MAYRTFGNIRDQVNRELDLEEETFVQTEEMTDYFNSAIRETEAEIMKLGLREKYLQDEDFISVVAGTKDYALPTDIIDTQIRKLIYRDGVEIYTINFQRGEEAYENENREALYSTIARYRATIYKTSEDYKLRLVPAAYKTVTDAIRVIYWKDLNRYASDATNCDVPEICYEFIRASVKYDCVKKEFGRPDVESFRLEKEAKRTLMIETLQGQVADPDINIIDPDISIYEEHS